jgi:hypothetical protein
MNLGRTTWWQECVREELLQTRSIKHDRKGPGTIYSQEPASHDLLPPGRPNFQMIIDPMKVAPPVGDHISNT